MLAALAIYRLLSRHRHRRHAVFGLPSMILSEYTR